MNKAECDEIARLVVSVRKDVEAMAAKGAALEAERNDLAKQLAAHVESLKQSNAQCADYHKRIELLAQELHETAAERHRLQLDCDAMQMKIAAFDGVINDRDKLHSELVEVRAALASVSAERDSLKRTLQEWEEAETKPQQRIPQVGFIQDDDAYFGVKLSVYGNDKKRTRKPAADIADHVVPPVVPMPAASIPLCMTCHECECELRINNHGAPGCFCGDCERMSQTVKTIAYWAVHSHPYYGPCPSKTKVRHE
jgi:hypothetical protein